MGAALAGTDKPILIASGVSIGTPRNGGAAIEDVPDPLPADPLPANPLFVTEFATAALIVRRIDVRAIRLAHVHDTTKAASPRANR